MVDKMIITKINFQHTDSDIYYSINIHCHVLFVKSIYQYYKMHLTNNVLLLVSMQIYYSSIH